jgi:hypothetical protein
VLLKKIFCGKLNDKSQWTIQVHGSLSKEMEGDVLICYLSSKGISKLKSRGP